METPLDAAAVYRTEHQRKLMVLTRCRNEAAPERDEFCRIRAVETLAPDLWLTATFLDGSTRRFRPSNVRVATQDEERLANQMISAAASTTTSV